VSLDEDEVVLESASIWDKIKGEIEGESIQEKTQSWDTVEYGRISRKQIASILEDKFKAERPRDPKVRKFRLSREKLKRLGSNYSSISKIEIIQEWGSNGDSTITSDTYDTCDASTDNETHPEVSKAIENKNNCILDRENMREDEKNIENIARQTSTIESLSSPNVSPSSPYVSEVSEVSLFGLDPCEGIASGVGAAGGGDVGGDDTTYDDEPILPSYVHRLGRSDKFRCDLCSVRDDKWGMIKHYHDAAG
jgi:hypothetical protein